MTDLIPTDDAPFELVDAPATKPIDLEFTDGEMDLIEQLHALRMTCNAMPGHDWHVSTYGAVSTALIQAIAQAVRNTQTDDRLRRLAPRIGELIADHATENGENIAYQLDLLRAGVIAPWPAV